MTVSKALHFSGGKDSLACLYLLQQDWDDIMVMWCNTGAAHASTERLMYEIAGMVPHFMEVKSDQPAFVREFGYPVDVLPLWRTTLGQQMDSRWGRKFVDWTTCCAHNIWAPMAKATRELGVTTVYRGQKKSDFIKPPITSGHVEEGVTYIFPVEDWSDDDVCTYLGDRLPAHYMNGEKTSRDCVNCTAFLHENQKRIQGLPRNDRTEVSIVLEDLRNCLKESVDQIDSIIGR